MNIRRFIGYFEIAIALLIATCSMYFLIRSHLYPELDRHGWLFMGAYFGVATSGFLAFSGAALLRNLIVGLLGHVPLIAITAIIWYSLENA